MKLVKQSTREGCTSFFILVDGECKGTVQKCSYYHKGYGKQSTWYTVWMGEKISLSPNLYWRGYLCNLGSGVEFKQALTTDRLTYAETGHKVRKRMIDWIKKSLETNIDCKNLIKGEVK